MAVRLSSNAGLPNPAALSDSLANPTTSQVGANLLVYDRAGSQWQRATQADVTAAIRNSGIAATALYGSDGSNLFPVFASAPGSDAQTPSNIARALATFAIAGNYNDGTGFLERQRNNTQGTLLASAARTATTTSANQTNYNARGVLVILNITAASGTGGLQTVIGMVDPISGSVVQYLASPTAITATGRYGYVVYPGASSSNAGSGFVNQAASGALARTWVATVNAGDSSSYTYSLGYMLIN